MQLTHRSFTTPKWLEYIFAYCGVMSVQGDPLEWVSGWLCSQLGNVGVAPLRRPGTLGAQQLHAARPRSVPGHRR